jgi:hypothetical protein
MGCICFLEHFQQALFAAVSLLESGFVRVPAQHAELLAPLMVAGIAQGQRVQVPHANATAQDVVHRRRPVTAIKAAGNAAVGDDEIQPAALGYRRRAFARPSLFALGLWLAGICYRLYS